MFQVYVDTGEEVPVRNGMSQYSDFTVDLTENQQGKRSEYSTGNETFEEETT